MLPSSGLMTRASPQKFPGLYRSLSFFNSSRGGRGVGASSTPEPRSPEFILKVLRVKKRRQSLEKMAELSEEDDAEEEKNNVAEDDLDFPEDNSKDQESKVESAEPNV